MMKLMLLMSFALAPKAPGLLTLFSLGLVLTTSHLWGVDSPALSTFSDSLSLLLIALTLWMVSVMLVVAPSPNTSHKLMIILMIILVSAFSTSSILHFYIWFEASLVPTFILILGWGYQPERLKAIVYLVLYTAFASLPLLVALVILTSQTPEALPVLTGSSINLSIALCFAGAFLVKLPVFAAHLWLLKAHVEAPVEGSMVLASILLKLGGYGLFRISSLIMSPMASSLLLTWSLAGAVVASFSCLYQEDIKALIALSSVAHMGVVAAVLFTAGVVGGAAALITMIAHGFSSAGLFYAASLSYLSAQSRSFKVMKGFMALAPSLALSWFLLCSANFGVPPTINLLGEVISITSLTSVSLFSWAPLGFIVLLAAAYSLTLFVKTHHGSLPGVAQIATPNPKHKLILITHWAPANLLILGSLTYF